MTSNQLVVPIDAGIPDEIEVGAKYINDGGYTMTVIAVDVEKRVARYRDDAGYTSSVVFADFIPGESGDKHPRWMLLPAEDLTTLILAPEKLMPEDAGDSDSTALGFRTSKNTVEAAKRHMAKVSQRAEIVRRLIEEKLAEVRGVARLTSARLDYMNQVLKAMESYLGLYQELLTIRDGEPAPFDAPIHFMQSILWMDEEVGDVELREGGRGIDFQSIDVFDKWVATGNNVRNIAPFPKCVVALQPSRQIRDYGDPLLNAATSSDNKIVYLLIRNGERLTRVCTTLIGGEVLFPTQDIWDKIAAAQANAEQSENEIGMLKAKSTEFSWLERIVLLQGLLERTTVLDPKPAGLNIFDPAVYDAGHVVLFRDFEQTKLPTGRPDFREWRKANLETIEVGSRIIYAGDVRVMDNYGLWRFGYRYSYVGSAPFPPSPGVYTVEEVEKDRYGWLRYRILYRPERYWGEDSQRRVSFWLENDDLILAYDQVSLEDVAYYIGLRIERRGYQKMLPMLYTIYRERVAEHAWEAEFVRSMAARLNVAEAAVWAAVEWWKMKVKSKRPITQDEAKAWRMIERKVKGIEHD